MPVEKQQHATPVRKLAAIMFTDIVGYTALMDKDEEMAFQLLQTNRLIHKPLIEKFRGKFLKEIGDGILASFPTVSDAVYCAGAIQNACDNEPALNLRIGIHQGEVVSHGNDVFGSGVNIASRIEAITPPGRIWVSDAVQRNIQNKKGVNIDYVREETLKNVEQPVRIYDIKVEKGYDALSNSDIYSELDHMAESSEKSIAILPFINMSNDPDQEYFCDGLSEELLNVFAKLDRFKVAARTSSFIFKGSKQDIAEIGRKLNVDTILEGSVRKSRNRMRITAQLINVADGFHLWSERYDRENADIFDIQDEIAMAILNALKVKLLGAEKKEVFRRSTDIPEAYELYLKGRFNFHKFSFEGYMQGIEHYKEAIAIEPSYAKAHAGLASCYLNLWHFEILPADKSLKQMQEATHKSIEYDDKIAESHLALARLKFWHEYDVSGAEKEFVKVMDFNPNIPDALSHYAFVTTFLGNKEKAIELGKRSLELDPFSPMTNFDFGSILWQCEKFDAVKEQANKMIETHPNFWGGYFELGLFYWSVLEYDQAIESFEKALETNYGLLILSKLGCLYGITNNTEKVEKTLRKLDEITRGKQVSNFCYAIVYAGSSDMDKTFYHLEAASKERVGFLIFLDIFRRRLIPEFKESTRLLDFMKKEQIPIYQF